MARSWIEWTHCTIFVGQDTQEYSWMLQSCKSNIRCNITVPQSDGV